MKKHVCKMAIWAVVACLVAPIHAGTVYVRRIDTTFIMNQWFTAANGGSISFNDTSLANGALYTHGDVLGLTINGGKMTFNSSLIHDFSSGNTARGYFDGDVTVTLTGQLRQSGTTVYNGTIFQATLVPLYEYGSHPGERWAFEADQFLKGNFDRSLELILDTTQGLAAGIAIGTDTLKMSDPRMDLFLKTDVSPSDFSQNLSSGSTTPSNIDFVAPIPEPMSLLLLAAGAVCLRKKIRIGRYC